MAGVRIVTDSSSDLSPEQAERLGIEVVPLSVRFGDEEFVDREELTTDEFYRRMTATDVLPQTAAPAPGAFEAAFRRCREQGADAVVCINLAGALSATMQSAQTAAKALEGEVDVRVLDSESVTMGLGSMVLVAAEAAKAGAEAADIVRDVESMVRRQRIWATLDTLDNLKKGGRIGGAKAMVATLLSIKPCISITHGSVEEAGRARTRSKALKWLADRLLEESTVEHLNVVHAQATDVEDFLELIRPRYPDDTFTVTCMGPIIGTHGGLGTLGVTYQLM